MRRLTAALAATTMITAAALVTAPAASAAGPRSTVNGWYADFLGRDASADPGSQDWVDRLGVQGAGDVLWAITHSREDNAQRLDDLYFFTLGRTASSDRGAGCWVRGVNDQRFPLEWVHQNVYASPEDTRGKPRAQIVGNWYAGIFTYDVTSFGEDNDRSPSAGAIAYWSPREVESDINVQVLIASTPEYATLAD